MARRAPLHEAVLPLRPGRMVMPFRLGAALLPIFFALAPVAAQDADLRPGITVETLSPERAPDGAANYGKPRPPRPGGKKPKKTIAHPLPALVAYPTSAEAKRAARDGQPPSPNTAMPALLPRKPKPKPDDDPFAPPGIDLGLLRLHLHEETDFGYSDNPTMAPKGAPNLRGSLFWRQEVGADAASDWNAHSLKGDVRLAYTDYFAANSANRPEGAGNLRARIDVTRQTKIDIDGNFMLSTQNPSSPNLYNNGLPVVLASQPLVANYGGGLGATQIFNRLDVSLRGGAERIWWANAHFSDGSVQPLSLDSYDDYGLTLRAAYELTPAVKPFIQGLFDRRIHDSPVDSSGYRRNSVGDALTLGSTFELTRLLTGQIAGGYGVRRYQDPRLTQLRGPMFDTSLVWTATPLTSVTLRGLTTMDETTVAGSPGAINRLASMEIAHALLRNLTLTAAGSVTFSNYVASNLQQVLTQAGLKAEYRLSRSIVVTGAFSRQRMTSTAPGTDYTANVVMVGLKLQR